jgi:hypothetical protein
MIETEAEEIGFQVCWLSGLYCYLIYNNGYIN